MKINEKFKNLIPPLTSEEFKQLEENCLEDGILESIKTWNGFIIDGHNRYEIAKIHNLSYKTKEMQFENEYDVIDWIIVFQLGRRNLTKPQKSVLRGEHYENQKLKGTTLNQYTKSAKSQNGSQQNTAEKLAKEYNVSERTILRDAEFSRGINLISSIEPQKRNEILQEKSELTKQEIQEFAKIPKQAENEVKKNVIIASEEEINQQIEIKAKELAKEKLKEIETQKELKKQEKLEHQKIKIDLIKERAKDFKNENIEIYNVDFREQKIEDGSIDLILTDPPYPQEYLHLWKDLFVMAKRVLKPNAFLIAYSGQMYLDKIFAFANEVGLDYYWIMNLEFTKKPLIHPRKVLNEWKPILIFQNGLKQHDKVFSDKINMKYSEREMHDLNWGQTIEPFEFLLDRFSNPNDLVFEPFAGTGTTLIACKNMKRRCIGTELENKYIDLIKGRLND